MFSLPEILIILIIHWVADFVFQTHKQAQGKSSNWVDLLGHTSTYSLSWYVSLPVLLFFVSNVVNVTFMSVSIFVLITFVSHTITDYYTSRLNTKLFKAKRIHDFFVSVGFDQWLHYLQLFGSYYLLFK